jgi:hypothetical protein
MDGNACLFVACNIRVLLRDRPYCGAERTYSSPRHLSLLETDHLQDDRSTGAGRASKPLNRQQILELKIKMAVPCLTERQVRCLPIYTRLLTGRRGGAHLRIWPFVWVNYSSILMPFLVLGGMSLVSLSRSVSTAIEAFDQYCAQWLLSVTTRREFMSQVRIVAVQKVPDVAARGDDITEIVMTRRIWKTRRNFEQKRSD